MVKSGAGALSKFNQLWPIEAERSASGMGSREEQARHFHWRRMYTSRQERVGNDPRIRA